MCLLVVLLAGSLVGAEYEANWESLDSHPLPQWYDDAKFGMFIHWGPYAADIADIRALDEKEGKPESLKTTHEWMRPELLTCENYDPHEWIRIARDAGMRYMVFTTKHGGGFAMYDTDYHKWNSVDSGPQRDLFGEFAQACHEEQMRFLAYYCKPDMFIPPDYQYNPFKSHYRKGIKDWDRWHEIVEKYQMQPIIDDWPGYFRNQVRELITKYRPDGIWYDSGTLPVSYLGTQELAAWVYNRYPGFVFNDRFGQGSHRRHGDFSTYETYGRTPQRAWPPDRIMDKKWERCITLDKNTWAYNPQTTLEDLMSAELVIHELVKCASQGGNYLLNIGPRADGSIPDYFVQRLGEVGDWMAINGEAIHNTRPWRDGTHKEGDVRFTTRGDSLYAICLKWPERVLRLRTVTPDRWPVTSVQMLGCAEPLNFSQRKVTGLAVAIPDEKPCEHAWVLKLTR